MLGATCLFLVIDFFYIFWIILQKDKFPHYIADYISKSLYGFTQKMKTTLYANSQKFRHVGV